MSNDLKSHWFTGMTSKRAMLFAVPIALLVFLITFYLCHSNFNATRLNLEAEQASSMRSWLTGTVNAVNIWTENLESQIKRISDSDLYRLFASEASLMDERTIGLLNDSDNGVQLPEDAQSLAEQIPLIRNVLLDFQNLSGYLDTRVVTRNGQTLLSALARPAPLTPEQRVAVDAAFANRRISFSPVRSSAAGLVIDLAAPMQATMLAGGTDEIVAAALVTVPVTGQIAQFLSRDLRSSNLLPHILQQTAQGWVEIQISSAVPVVLEATQAQALVADPSGELGFGQRPGIGFGEPVYSMGMLAPRPDWWVVLEVPAADFNKVLRSQALLIYGIGFLIGVGLLLLLALAWWSLYGRQQRIIAQHFEQLYRLIDQQKRLLDSVNLSLDVGLFMADIKGNVLIGNRAFADIAGTTEETLEGSTLSGLLNAKSAGELLENVRSVATSNQPKTIELSLDRQDGPHLYRIDLYPIEDKVKGDGVCDDTKGAVATMQDITEFRRNSEKRRMQQVHTIHAFIKAVEGVDPYLAGHSSKMSKLGELLAQQMQLSETDRNTITLAANLSQVGKLFVPRELLCKTCKLTEAEQQEMNKVPEHAYRVLKDIDFELPVPEAIYQMNEKPDGSGFPQGLKDSDISLYARILAVLNAFTAMVSPRSYRESMTPEQAIAQLRSAPNAFDQQIVDALAQVAGTSAGLQAVAAKPE